MNPMLYKKERMIRPQTEPVTEHEPTEWDVPAGAPLTNLDTTAGPERCLTKSEFLGKQQAGEYVGLSAKTIERLIGREELRAYKFAGKIKVRCEDLEAWIAANVIKPNIHSI